MSDWKSFAEKLGLRYEKRSRLTGHEIITGLVDGRSVSATFVPGETEHVRVRAFITPALDLGIDVGLLTQLPLLSTTKTGHPRFYDSFRLRADEPERAKQLLTEEVRNAITACESLFHTAIELSDDSMGALGLWPLNSDHSAVVGRMQLVARVAAAVEVARRHVPVATALRAHEAAWEAFADSMNLELLRCPLGIQGKMSGHSFSASVARRRKNAYGFDVRVELAQPLGLDLEIRPASLWEKASELFGRGDVKLDDPAFDAAGAPRRAYLAAALAELDRQLGGRLVVRASGTEPVIRVMAEGDDQTMVTAIVDDLIAALAQAPA